MVVGGMVWKKDRAIIFGTLGIFPQKKKTIMHSLCGLSPSFMSTLCNHLFLLFQALEALALTEEDRGPQQVEIFILGMEEEEVEVEEEEEGSESVP